MCTQMLMHTQILRGVQTPSEYARKVDSGRKILCRTGESNLHQRRAGPTLCQLGYISVPKAGEIRFSSFSFFSICVCRSADHCRK